MPVPVRRSFVDVPAGTIHVATAGEGEPVLLLHQTPRSWMEYRDVLPILGERFRAVAMDTIGFGDSSKPAFEDTLERWAEVAVSLLDALGIERAHLVGHHTGGVIAMEIAASAPDRVGKLVLSAAPYCDEHHREAHGGAPPVDNAVPQLDGSHLVELWSQRAPYYPKDVDLLERFMVDALKAGPRAAEGHMVVGRYEMEKRIHLVQAPTLVIAPTDDPFAYPDAPKIAAAIPGSRLVELSGAMVPAPDQMPEEFARVVADFLSS